MPTSLPQPESFQLHPTILATMPVDGPLRTPELSGSWKFSRYRRSWLKVSPGLHQTTSGVWRFSGPPVSVMRSLPMPRRRVPRSTSSLRRSTCCRLRWATLPLLTVSRMATDDVLAMPKKGLLEASRTSTFKAWSYLDYHRNRSFSSSSFG